MGVFVSALSKMPGIFRAMLIASEGEQSVWGDIWDYLVEKYFTVDFAAHNYSHIEISQNSMLSIRGIIIALFIGIMIAAAASLYQKRTLGDLVRAIAREQATTPEKAMTLTELGLQRNAAIKEDLRHGTSLNRVVHCVEEETFRTGTEEKHQAFLLAKEEGKENGKWREVPYVHDFSSEHYYIPEDKIIGADIQFDKKGSNGLSLFFTVIVCIVLMSLTCLALPEILQFVDNFIGVFS